MASLTESDLWGLQLAPKKTYSQTVEMPFRLTMAALGPSINSTSRCCVFVRIGDDTFLLCTLTSEKCEQQILNLVFQVGEEITFYTDGENPICLTGNFLIYSNEELAEGGSYAVDSDYSDMSDDYDEEIDSDDIDFIDDSDEEDEVDVDPKIMEIKNSKDIKALSKGSEKGKHEKHADSEDDDVDEEDEEEDDDEDSEDDDEDDDEEDFDSEEYDDEELDSDEEDEDDEEIDSEEVDSEEEEMEVPVKGQDNKRPAPASLATPAKKPAVAQQAESKPVAKNSTPVSAVKNQKTDAKGTPLKQDTDLKKAEEKKENAPGAANKSVETGKAVNQKGQATSEQKTNSPATKPVTEEKIEKKVVNLGSGLSYEEVQPGKGPVVTKGQKVNVLYKGTLSNGKVFDENFSSKQALQFVVGKKEVVEGLDRAIQGAHVGGVRKITIPPQLAYGNKKLDGIPPNSTLTFEIKVLSVAGKQQPQSK